MRIDTDHDRLPAVNRGEQITVTVDGQEAVAFQGESVAALLFAKGKRAFRYSDKESAEPLPGFFCGMGVCYGCLIKVDGRLRRACLTEVNEGMRILTRPEDQP